MASPRSRSHLTPLHTRNMSTVTVESDSSDTSANPLEDDDTDYFVAHPNDSQSSLGAITVVRDCDPDVDMEETHRLTPISKLPPEILISILAKLTTTADLKSCMLVSYYWAIYAAPILWHRPLCNKWSNLLNVVATLGKAERAYFPYHDMVKRLNLSAISDKINDGTVQPFMGCKGIERLTLTNCSKLTDFGVAGLVDSCRKLQALDVTDLDSLTDRTLQVVADNCSKLQGLNITNCSNVTDESLVQIAENCRQLKRLKLNGVFKITEASVTAVARNCRSILEIDLAGCQSISPESVTALLSSLAHLRELRLAHCIDITDSAFTNLSPHLSFDALRILDLTACEQVRDDAISRIIPAAPRLRNLVLAKCRHITDRAISAICKLTKNLHYIHLGHCINLTDYAVIQLVKACNRIRYIDLACCSRLTDASVRHLAQLPKLRRIGLVKCQNLTDASIIALAHGPLLFGPTGKIGVPSQFVSLERVHLSYCVNLTLKGITALLHNCPRLTHLSLTGVQAFLREDLTRFCRDAPAEFTHPQRDVFCVFSGEGVSRLRDHLMRLAIDEAEREGREAADENIMDSPGVETMSDDGTIDGNEHLMDPLHFQRHGISPYLTNPRARPRPRSMHELPSRSSFHVDLPLMSSAQMQTIGSWTPSGPVTPEGMPLHNHHHITVINPHAAMPEMDFEPRVSRPGAIDGFNTGSPYEDRTRSTSQTPSRRHTLAETGDGLIPGLFAGPHYAGPSGRPFDSYFDQGRGVGGGARMPPQVNLRPGTTHLWNLDMRSAVDIRQTYLRPEQDYSAFDANHEAIMATIPASAGSSRQASRSNSPHPGRVSSRSRLSNLISGIRTYGASPFTYAEAAARGLRASRSRDRSRMEEEERREAMLRAMAEADSAHQLRPDLRRDDTDRNVELLPQLEMVDEPLVQRGLAEQNDGGRGTPGTPPMDDNEDVTMTQ